jgi:hypothetical protein
MVAIGGPTSALAANSMDTVINTAGIAVLVVGALLLFAGVKLVRLLCTLGFATLGAAVGLAVNNLLNGVVDVPGSPWLIPVAGAVILGLAAFLLYKLWLTLAFGCLLSAGSAVGYVAVMAGPEVSKLPAQCQDMPAGFVDTVTLAMEFKDIAVKLKQANAKPEDKARLDELVEHLKAAGKKFEGGTIPLTADDLISKEDIKTLDELMKTYGNDPAGTENLHARLNRQFLLFWKLDAIGEEMGGLLRKYGMGMAIAAVVGLMVGLLIGGLAWRLAAVLMTSLAGLVLAGVGLAAVLHQHKPDLLRQAQGYGAKTLLIGAGVVWLLGVAMQGLVARRKKKGPATAELA